MPKSILVTRACRGPDGVLRGENEQSTESDDVADYLVSRGWAIEIPESEPEFDGSEPTRLLVYRARIASGFRNIEMPSPYAPALSAHILHPSVVFVPEGWNGYRYWAVHTPYPDGDSEYENPCVYASHDGVNWRTPPGLSNPVEPSPPGLTYNSDTHLYLVPDRSRLILLFRARGSGLNTLKIKESGDGVRWSPTITIWQGSTASQNDMASPSLWWDPATRLWTMIGHNLDGVAPYPVRKMTSSYLAKGWPAVPPVTLTFPVAAGRQWWHSYFQRLRSGQIVGVAQNNASGSASAGDVYAAWSNDGVNFYSSLLVKSGQYRPTWVLKESAANGAVIGELYLSGLNQSTLKQAIVAFDGPTAHVKARAEARAVAEAAAALRAGFVLGDLFNRADSASSLGTAPTGQSYTVSAGTFGISSNRAYGVTAGNNRMMVALGALDGYAAQVIFETLGDQCWFIFRGVDSSNYWRFGKANAASATYTLQNIVAGATGDVSVGAVWPIAAGDIIRIETKGDQIAIYVNDQEVYTLAHATHAGGSSIGFQCSGAGPSYFEDLVAWAI